MLRIQSILFLVPVFLGMLAVLLPGSEAQTGFIKRQLELEGTTYLYQVYLPPEWNEDQSWPVILFLHGAGERGEDGIRQTEVGIGPAIRRHPERFPAIVVMPQCRTGVWWTDGQMIRQALQAMETAIHEYRGDRRRLYLTGLSMGGYGTWEFACRNPNTFAALVPICGGIVPPSRVLPEGQSVDRSDAVYLEAAGRVGQTPVWVFHGDSDSAVPVTESRKMVEALKQTGGSVRYTEFPGVGHNSWDPAYADPDLITWMLQQQGP